MPIDPGVRQGFSFFNRPNGPGERSPGLRPKADALGRKATKHRGLKGRDRFSGIGSALGSGQVSRRATNAERRRRKERLE